MAENSNHFGATRPTASPLPWRPWRSCAAPAPRQPWRLRRTRFEDGQQPWVCRARRSGAPFILDMAMSVARGKMRKLRDGRSIPSVGRWTPPANRPLIPAGGLDGFIQFIGGHKGYGLSLMVEMLAAPVRRTVPRRCRRHVRRRNLRASATLHRHRPNPTNGRRRLL